MIEVKFKSSTKNEKKITFGAQRTFSLRFKGLERNRNIFKNLTFAEFKQNGQHYLIFLENKMKGWGL